MKTIREWLKDHPQVDSWTQNYGEDQPGGFGRKGWSAYGGTPDMYYVMAECWTWDHLRNRIHAHLIVTLKYYRDAGIKAEVRK